MHVQLAPQKNRKSAVWLANRERGSLLLLRMMAWVSLHLGRRVSRVPLYAIAAYFFLFAPRARRHAARYLGLALGRPARARDRFRQVLYFASTIHDRVYLINQREDLFEITVEGDALMRAQLATRRGALLMGSHMGSFEIVGAVGKRQPGLHVVMAMYEQNARKIGGILAAINPRADHDVISLGRLDAMLQISERLAAGGCVGMMGDRTLGKEPLRAVTILGRQAQLPTGPMRMAAILGCTVIFMIGLYRGGNRYHVVFAELADFSGVSSRDRGTAVGAAVDRYAALLDRYCRSDPYNWFNFYEFFP